MYECSNTVEQRMIPGGSNERLTNTGTHVLDIQSSSIQGFPRGSPACFTYALVTYMCWLFLNC